MGKPDRATCFRIVESARNLLDTLDDSKTTSVFSVLSIATPDGEPGDFMGIISRKR